MCRRQAENLHFAAACAQDVEDRIDDGPKGDGAGTARFVPPPFG
jgi:hypothetical protein